MATLGSPGYRTRFDVDNVLVTGGTRYLMLMDTMEAFFQSGAMQRGTGTWQQITIDDEQDSFHFYFRQTATSGDARIFSRTPIPDQVVSARMRPLAYGATSGSQDPWIGVAARVVDANNYLYMTLRRSNQLSLRKLVNGYIQVLTTVPVNVAANQWYDLRLEVIGKLIRGYVNGDLKFELNDSSLPATGAAEYSCTRRRPIFGPTSSTSHDHVAARKAVSIKLNVALAALALAASASKSP